MEKSDSNSYNNILAPPPPPASINLYGDSCEEQAFAVDASGVLGGCVWPPRFYSCSFCRREFRSAQALGGHMNVHRRDRARLKQSPINIPPPPAPEVVPGAVNPCTRHLSFDHASPYSCTDYFLYNNSNPNPEIRVSSPDPPSTIKSSTLSFFSPISQQSSHIVNHTVNDQSPPVPQSWSSFVSKKRECFALDLIENHLSVGLNSAVCKTKKKAKEEVGSCNKRRRTDQENPLRVLAKSSGGVDKCNLLHLSQELDLELRLGDASKVK